VGTREEYDEILALYGPETFLDDLGIAFGDGFTLARPRGCNACGGSGYKGRIGIHELLLSDPTIKHAIAEKAPVEQIRKAALGAGMRTLLQDGIHKVMTGQTDMKQVLAVCSRN
jgi:type II secretory ATPase GspE/PulE/Tfp pilus assembly ATPase PilB-like protein